MIGDMLSKILKFFRDIFVSVIDWFKGVFGEFFDFLYDCFVWLGELLQRLFQALINVLVSFFEVIYDIIRGVLYFLYMVGVLAVNLFTLFFELAKILWAFVVGFGRTIASLFYTESTSANHGYSQMMGEVIQSMDVLQLDVVAYILLFIIWVMTALGVFHVIGTIRNL